MPCRAAPPRGWTWGAIHAQPCWPAPRSGAALHRCRPALLHSRVQRLVPCASGLSIPPPPPPFQPHSGVVRRHGRGLGRRPLDQRHAAEVCAHPHQRGAPAVAAGDPGAGGPGAFLWPLRLAGPRAEPACQQPLLRLHVLILIGASVRAVSHRPLTAALAELDGLGVGHIRWWVLPRR